MAHDPTWSSQAQHHSAHHHRPKTAGGSIACIMFVGAMGLAFWVGAFWASQTFFHLHLP